MLLNRPERAFFREIQSSEAATYFSYVDAQYMSTSQCEDTLASYNRGIT